MHRPPRPAIKSSLMFPLHPLRRILTPQAFHQENDLPIQDVILKNMRENALPSHIHHSANNTNNLQNLEQKSINEQPSLRAPPSYTRSFKIRNHTNNHRIKENTIPIKSGRKIATSNRLAGESNNTIEVQKNQTKSCVRSFAYQSYSSEMELCEIGNRIQFEAVHSRAKDQDQPCMEREKNESVQTIVIISQSIFQGNLIEDACVSKIKKVCNGIKSMVPEVVKIVFRIQNERQVQQLCKSWRKNEVEVDFIIWPKAKYYERTMALDISEITSLCSGQKVLVFEDQFDFCQTLFYSSVQDENKDMANDDRIKYLYLSFPALASLQQFLAKPPTFPDDFHIITQYEGCKDLTREIMNLGEIKRKIKLAKCRKVRRADRLKRKQSSKDLRSEYVGGSMHNIQQKTEQFKRKMVQYVKILQEDKRYNKGAIVSKPESAKSERSRSCGPLKLVQSRNQSRGISKTSNQIVYELLKNNTLVHKQIAKYQEQTLGVDQKALHHVK